MEMRLGDNAQMFGDRATVCNPAALAALVRVQVARTRTAVNQSSGPCTHHDHLGVSEHHKTCCVSEHKIPVDRFIRAGLVRACQCHCYGDCFQKRTWTIPSRSARTRE
jgi:hypothetical protein